MSDNYNLKDNMALPSTIYRASIELSDLDRNCYESLQVTVAQHPSETAERMVARLLAYALCYREGLVFTKGISAGDEPDLWLKGPDGRVDLWVEVGVPEPERIVKATRHAREVIVYVCGNSQHHWQKQHLSKLSNLSNLTIYLIDQQFIRQVAQHLQRSIIFGLTITEGLMYLTVGNETLETALVPVKS
jgi:uncharacterized protein YaeQ